MPVYALQYSFWQLMGTYSKYATSVLPGMVKAEELIRLSGEASPTHIHTHCALSGVPFPKPGVKGNHSPMRNHLSPASRKVHPVGVPKSLMK